MKKTIAILAFAALGITGANAGVRFGINFGIPVPAPVVVAPALVCVQPPMPAPIVEAQPLCPTPGYVWVRGNWGWCDNHWVWTRGHWGAPPTGMATLIGVMMAIGTEGSVPRATRAFTADSTQSMDAG